MKTKAVLTLDDAQRIGQAAMEHAKAHQWAVAVAVVDDGWKSAASQVAAGLMKLEGDASILGKLGALMVDFDPRFQIMPGTRVRTAAVQKTEPFEVSPKTTIAE